MGDDDQMGYLTDRDDDGSRDEFKEYMIDLAHTVFDCTRDRESALLVLRRIETLVNNLYGPWKGRRVMWGSAVPDDLGELGDDLGDV